MHLLGFPFHTYLIGVAYHRDPIIQYSQKNTAIFVYLTLVMSFFSYARFCTLVINDITNYLGIACFTVRKKDAGGVWRDTKEIPSNNEKKA
jgi:ethanolaminephosphotransferase